MKKFAAYIIFPVLLILVSCGDKEPSPVIYPTDPSTKHTLLIYMGIHNNFSSEKYKIELLRQSWSADYDANLLIYADGGPNTVLVHIHHDKNGNNVADTVDKWDRENSADPEVFNRVLKRAYEDWPAKTNGLVSLSHASGWLKEGKLGSPKSRTVINDGYDGPELDLWDFASNIPIKLDYVIFDACFMSGVEVMSELKGKSSYVVGSSAEVLAEYIQYPAMVSSLLSGPEPDFKEVVDNTYEYAHNNRWSLDDPKYISLTMSVVNVDKFTAMENLCRKAFSGIPDIEAFLGKNLKELQQFYPIDPLYTDLGDLIQNLRPDLYAEFSTILKECVPYSVYTPTYYSAYPRSTGGSSNAIKNFSGLTMYVPQAAYPGLNEDYKILKWYKAVFQ